MHKAVDHLFELFLLFLEQLAFLLKLLIRLRLVHKLDPGKHGYQVTTSENPKFDGKHASGHGMQLERTLVCAHVVAGTRSGQCRLAAKALLAPFRLQ